MRSAVLGAVLLLALASGCSAGEAEPAEVEPLVSGSASAASPTKEATPGSMAGVPSTASEPVEKSVEATPPITTEQEASAFVRRFFDLINQAYTQRDAADVRRLSAPACGSCAAVADDVERLAAEGHVVPGRRYVLTSAEAAPARPDGQVVVDFRFNSDAYVEQDGTGTVVQRFPAESARDGQVLVDPSRDRLRVAAIRLLDQ